MLWKVSAVGEKTMTQGRGSSDWGRIEYLPVFARAASSLVLPSIFRIHSEVRYFHHDRHRSDIASLREHPRPHQRGVQEGAPKTLEID